MSLRFYEWLDSRFSWIKAREEVLLCQLSGQDSLPQQKAPAGGTGSVLSWGTKIVHSGLANKTKQNKTTGEYLHSELGIMSLFTSQHLSIFIGSAKILGSVTVSTPCESVLYTVAVPRTQSHYLCVHSVSPDRHSLCWFQIHQGLPPVSQAFILPAFVWSAPSLCHPPERDPLLMEKSSPFSFLALKPDLCLCGSIHSFCYKIHM